jgi:hypothetical protein
MENNLLDNQEYFMYLASNKIVQRWLREVDNEELAAASLSMDEDLLNVIRKALAKSENDIIKEGLIRVNDENCQNLIKSFYQKLLKVLIISSHCPDLPIPSLPQDH